jgi:hypothetical protein
MSNIEIIDMLTYRSWWAQVYLYGMSIEKARVLFPNQWMKFEEMAVKHG